MLIITDLRPDLHPMCQNIMDIGVKNIIWETTEPRNSLRNIKYFVKLGMHVQFDLS